MLSKAELEDLRPWVANNVSATLGSENNVVIQVALDCIEKNMSRQATQDQLSPFLSKDATQFVASLYKKVLEIKTAKLMAANFTSASKKRPLEADKGTSNGQAASDKPPAKKKKTSRFAPTDDSAPPDTGDVQSLLESTRRQIEEKKRQTEALLTQTRAQVPASVLPGVVPSKPLLPTPAEETTPIDFDAVEKAKRMSEIQARIQAQIKAQGGLLTGKPSDQKIIGKPGPLILDKEGRTVDKLGRAVQMSARQPTFKVNIRAQQRTTFRQITEKKTTAKDSDKVEGSFMDGRVFQGASGRGRKQLKFNEPGKYVKQAQVLRAKAQLDALHTQISSVARKTGISSATKLALIAPSSDSLDVIPDVEWWDGVILTAKSYTTDVPRDSRYQGISNLIEHPITVEPPADPGRSVPLPIILTSKERKKLRKQRRREAEREKQEKIQFGLVDKPEPKVRISNLMRVLGSEAVQDPTKVEAHVRSQMAERQKKHEEANLARKLTPDQRRNKKLNKMKEDLSLGVHVTVYRVHDLSNPAIKFKVDMNAQQLHLTGCLMLFHDVNLVIVEGGPKVLKKFRRLMLHRIKWKPKERRGAAEDDADSDSETANMCTVVWEGVVHDRAFRDWRVRTFPTEPLARDHLKKHKIEHYWDLALSQRIVEQEET